MRLRLAEILEIAVNFSLGKFSVVRFLSFNGGFFYNFFKLIRTDFRMLIKFLGFYFVGFGFFCNYFFFIFNNRRCFLCRCFFLLGFIKFFLAAGSLFAIDGNQRKGNQLSRKHVDHKQPF